MTSESVVCDALYRVPTADGDSEVDVCGTYATKDEEGVVRCEAGHVTRPKAPVSH